MFNAFNSCLIKLRRKKKKLCEEEGKRKIKKVGKIKRAPNAINSGRPIAVWGGRK